MAFSIWYIVTLKENINKILSNCHLIFKIDFLSEYLFKKLKIVNFFACFVNF